MKRKKIASSKKETYTEDDMAMRIYALSDVVFKYIFGTVESTEILKDFINAVLRDSGFTTITEVTIINPNNPGTYLDEKISVIDTRAKDEDGDIYNVEVQIRCQADYQERSLYYWAKAYSEQLKKGHEYGVLHRVISISILDFVLFPEHIPFHSCFMLRENSNPEYALTTDCIMHYIETPKLKEKPITGVEQWLYFLQHIDEEDDEEVKVLIDNHAMFKAAMERYEYFSADEKARYAYLAREMFLHDQASNLANARREGLAEGRRQAWEEAVKEGRRLGLEAGMKEGQQLGREEGLQEGRQQGKQEGLMEGRQRGKQEGERARAAAIARALKDRGMSTREIADITGLNPEELP